MTPETLLSTMDASTCSLSSPSYPGLPEVNIYIPYIQYYPNVLTNPLYAEVLLHQLIALPERLGLGQHIPDWSKIQIGASYWLCD